MGLLILILLVWAAVTGVLWGVLKIAVGVALGMFLGGVLLAALAYRGIRRALNDPERRRPRPRY